MNSLILIENSYCLIQFFKFIYYLLTLDGQKTCFCKAGERED